MATEEVSIAGWWSPIETRRPLHIEIDHQQQQRFRWLALFEFMFLVPAVLIALPLALLGAGGLLGAFGRRAIRRSRIVVLRLVYPDTDRQLQLPVSSRERGHEILTAVLERAIPEGLVVVERVEGGAVVACWWGGLPCLQPEPSRTRSELVAALEQDMGRFEERPDGGWQAVFEAPSAQLEWLAEAGRHPMAALRKGREAYRAARGTESVSVAVGEGRLMVDRTRGAERIDVPLGELLGVQWRPVIDYRFSLKERPPVLHVVTARAHHLVSLPLGRSAGRALVELIQPYGRGTVETSCPACGERFVGGRVCGCGVEQTNRGVRNLSRRFWSNRRA